MKSPHAHPLCIEFVCCVTPCILDEGGRLCRRLFFFYYVGISYVVRSRISTSCALGMRETRVAPCLRIKSRACDPIPLPPLLLSFGRGEKHFCSDDSRSSHLTYLCHIRLRYVKSLSIGFDLDIFFFFFLLSISFVPFISR